MTLFYKLVITDLAGNETESEENKFIPAQAYEDSLLRLVMIDVGWGDALYFETPGQVNALIDSGHNSGGYNHLGDVLRFLNTYKEQKITAINHGVMTHLHSDHADGFVYGLLGAIKFDDFLDAEPHIERYYQQGDYLSEYYGELLDILHEQQIKRITPKTDQKFEWDTDVEIKVLNAGNPFSDDNENHSSLVLKIKYRNFHLLLTGDAEEPNESRILSQYGSIVESEVLKVGHHGNDDASSQSFIDAVSPVVALVPVDPQEVEGALPDKIIIDRIKTSGAHVFESNSASPLNSLTLHADVEVLSDGYFFTVILDSE
jgi:competence protein ComEC